MLNLIELVGFGSGRGPANVTFTDSGTNASSATSHTYTSISLGTASSERVIIVCAGADAGAVRTITAITVHVPDITTDPTGTALAEVIYASDGTGGGSKLSAIWSGTVTTGTSGDIKVTYSAAMQNAGISVFAVSGIAATADSTGTDTTLTGNALSADVTGYTDGIIIAVCYWGTSDYTTAWTNATEETDLNVDGGYTHSAAQSEITSTSTVTVTATASGTPNRKSLAVASWRPL